nr:thioredoxin family protein [Desulfonema magnum]
MGAGGGKCKHIEKLIREAADETGADAQIEKITTVMKIAGYGVFGTPLLLKNMNINYPPGILNNCPALIF